LETVQEAVQEDFYLYRRLDLVIIVGVGISFPVVLLLDVFVLRDVSDFAPSVHYGN